jgi:hypothetical protein
MKGTHTRMSLLSSWTCGEDEPIELMCLECMGMDFLIVVMAVDDLVVWWDEA